MQIQYQAICDVCRLVDKDYSIKECGFCPMCDSYICTKDNNRWDRRLIAAIKRKIEPGYTGLPDYEKNIQETGK